jgi:transcription initiation factor IIE alpha subunit
MKELVALNKKEQARLMVLNELERGEITGGEVAEVLGLSLRHVKRIQAAYRRKDTAAFRGLQVSKKYNHCLALPGPV